MKIYLGILLLAVWAVDCQQEQDCFGEGTFANDIKSDDVIHGIENFSLKIFSNIAKQHKTASFIMSPFSIWSVLKLAYYGATGETERELQTALGVPSKRDAFWASHLIDLRRKVAKDETFSSMDKAYFANDVTLRQCALGKVVGIKKLDFKQPNAAAKIINDDISKATKGEIQNFVNGNYIARARFVLINAVYFKGKWVNKFDKALTAQADFFDESDTAMTTKAVMMETTAKLKFGRSDPLQSEIVELPYEGTNFVMMIILPNKGQTVNNILNTLTATTLKEAQRTMRPNVRVFLQMPAFNFTTKIDRLLRESLNGIGIKALFDPSRASLRDFVPNENLAVSNSLHQATIRVDEEGTVAAAATGLIVTRTGAERIFNFVANRPFLFLLRDNDLDITFFIGVYRNPADSIVA